MRAIYYEEFCQLPQLVNIPDPRPSRDAVIVEVKASGLCLSDWHGWMGHDPDIKLPHVPGHELAGVIVDCGKDVRRWRKGQRITVPFVGGCGQCHICLTGNPQVCPKQFQPGFTHWGSFAEYVEIKYADFNLVQLPDSMPFVDAASLGCRFTTAFRAVVDQGKLKKGECLAVIGCGGVGLSAVVIAKALGATVAAIDPKPSALDMAKRLGADVTISSTQGEEVRDELFVKIGGGANVSIDAFGSSRSFLNSLACLDRRGRHVQVGLVNERVKDFSLSRIIAEELEIIGSHGIQASRFVDIFQFLERHGINPGILVNRTISLEEAIADLVTLDKQQESGISVIDSF